MFGIGSGLLVEGVLIETASLRENVGNHFHINLLLKLWTCILYLAADGSAWDSNT